MYRFQFRNCCLLGGFWTVEPGMNTNGDKTLLFILWLKCAHQEGTEDSRAREHGLGLFPKSSSVTGDRGKEMGKRRSPCGLSKDHQPTHVYGPRDWKEPWKMSLKESHELTKKKQRIE